MPALAFPAAAVAQPGRLPVRDFDLGRGIGVLAAVGPPAAATADLMTKGDNPADWLRAGQAMHRLLTRAATCWVFASLHSEPLEIPAVRAMIRSRLALPGEAQMLLQLGLSRSTRPTPRRPVTELLIGAPSCQLPQARLTGEASLCTRSASQPNNRTMTFLDREGRYGAERTLGGC